MNDKTKKSIEKALYKRAVGYDTKETVEEFAESDGEVILTKRKITTKNVPPDITAVKLLLDMNVETADVTTLSDEELEEEKQRLLKLISEVKENESK